MTDHEFIRFGNKVGLSLRRTQTSVLFVCLFVWVDALRASQQFFSHVGTEPPLPGYFQYFFGGKCFLPKDTTRRPELGSNPRPLAPENVIL